MGCVGNCCARASKSKANAHRMTAVTVVIARRLQDILDLELDQLLPVGHRGAVGTAHKLASSSRLALPCRSLGFIGGSGLSAGSNAVRVAQAGSCARPADRHEH